MDLYEKKQLQYKYILITIIAVCIAVVLSANITYYCFMDHSKSNLQKINIGETPDSEQAIEAIAETLKGFRELIDSEYKYKDEIDENSIMDSTIKGYVNGLGDKYSEYMTAEEWKDFQMSALGDFEGIGIYVSSDKSGNTVILSAIKDSPAEAIGLKKDDIIVEVDGENVLGIGDSSKVTTKIKGPAGTKVHIKIARGEEYLEYDIERAMIKLYHVESEMLDNNIGYIELMTFDTDCAKELEQTIKDLESKGAKKLILDIRHNTGGLVSEACTIANLFLPKDKEILITEFADGHRETTMTDKDNITDLEMVLLVDEYSASASEILAGALKDNGRAKVVGTTTYGKGVIQNVFSLSDDSVLKLTIAEYFTPKETKINGIGLEPDYKVELPESEDDEEEVEDTQLNKAKELLK